MNEGLGAPGAGVGEVKPPPLSGGQHVGVAGGRGHDRDAAGGSWRAARTIAGPPMSICSTHSSGVAPDTTVSAKG